MSWQVQKGRRDEWLKAKVCEKCGGTDYLAASWKVQPGPFWTPRIWQFADPEKRQGYLADCLVLCRSCRARRAQDKRRKEHGEGVAGVKGCNCDLCREGRNRGQRAYRARSKERGQK